MFAKNIVCEHRHFFRSTYWHYSTVTEGILVCYLHTLVINYIVSVSSVFS